MPLFSPQTILVTGASQGIGRELALQLAAQGHTVIAWARTQALLNEIASQRIHVAVVDLADTAVLPAHVAALLAAHPELSGVIHNAAIQVEHLLSDTTPTQVQLEIAINLTAPIVLTQLLLPHLKLQNQAFICNISSALALAAKRKSAVYCATKAGLHLFSDSLRAQLAGTGIQVTEVMPPTVQTRMTAGRQVPKMQAADVARLTMAAIRGRKRTALLGKAKLLGVLLWLAPPLAKKIMLQF
jgi:uncharacterized oxidoreductase